MKCDFCEGQTRTRRVKKHHWFGGRLYVVENVPSQVCGECGQRYFHASTLDAIDLLLANDPPVKQELKVEVVSM